MEATTRVLVGYATAAGSTAGIAERLAATLQAPGVAVDWRPVGPDLDPAVYDVVVLGSAVHNMAWLRPALDFLGRLAATGDAPTWCFSVGGVDPHGPLTRRMTSLEVGKVEQDFPAGFRPRDHRFFGGIVEMSGVPLWGRLFWRLFGGRPGDHRNWPAVDAWAGDIAAALPGTRPVGGPERP